MDRRTSDVRYTMAYVRPEFIFRTSHVRHLKNVRPTYVSLCRGASPNDSTSTTYGCLHTHCHIVGYSLAHPTRTSCVLRLRRAGEGGALKCDHIVVR